MVDLNRPDALTTIGEHKDTISTVKFSSEYNLIVSGSWDKNLKFFDTRAMKPVHKI
jgi:cell cycle arrest protein BUB3